jgi:hypothetical protein
MLYRRLIAQGIEAARIGSLVGPPPTPSGTPRGDAVAAVLRARARLEPMQRPRAVAERPRAASA